MKTEEFMEQKVKDMSVKDLINAARIKLTQQENAYNKDKIRFDEYYSEDCAWRVPCHKPEYYETKNIKEIFIGKPITEYRYFLATQLDKNQVLYRMNKNKPTRKKLRDAFDNDFFS